ncbi:MAG TPA: HD domain-containing phosphohydrolase [Pyrinomonadaceae bacterium]|jgi:HD-GYP domain-containing protein (c-di-GMP phosphodiesterase class II)|nr:HD domain-containing phosphohydrolase [Pyrinomonadaceae bacterium]
MFPEKKSIVQDHEFDARLLKMAAVIDEFEGYTRPHAVRLAVLGDAVAEKFNLGLKDRLFIRQAALVHDIGEVMMNREYIKSPRSLTDAERLDLMRHPVIGEQEAAKRGLSRAVQLFIRWHHEWWNGNGYPDTLERDAIPLGARILRVVDTYCALTDNRPYKKAVTASEAREYLRLSAGIEFDPEVVTAFFGLSGIKELDAFVQIESAPAEAPAGTPIAPAAPNGERNEALIYQEQ